jgi:hypothetical protein
MTTDLDVKRSLTTLLALLLLAPFASESSPLDRLDLRDSAHQASIRSAAYIGHVAYVAASEKQESRAAPGARDEVPPDELPDTSQSKTGPASTRHLDPAVSSRRRPVSNRVVADRAPPDLVFSS